MQEFDWNAVEVKLSENGTHVYLPTKARGPLLDEIKSSKAVTLGRGREKCIIEFTDQAFTGTAGYKEPART